MLQYGGMNPQTTLSTFEDKKVAILGLGVEGLSTGRFLAKQGAKLTFFDQKVESELEKASLGDAKNLGKVVLGTDAFVTLSGFDFVFRSPGVNKNHSILETAAKEGAVITSQTKLFFDLCPCPIIGVTGSKGKGTTATLIYLMLIQSGRDVHLGGNIGTPPLDFLDQLTETSVVVLELSSFQLQDLTKSPHIAVLLMLTPEHLAPTHWQKNFHKDFQDYIDTKRNILRFQTPIDFAVINRDYLPSHESDTFTDGKIFQVSLERQSTEQGCFVKDGAIWILHSGNEKKIIDTKDIALLGKHNWENACAAAMSATLAGAAKSDMVEVLSTFKGLPHRIELVRELNGVKYYDDSIATNPESAIAAINAFADPKILILGGVTEGSDFTKLGEVIAKERTIKAIIGIGKDWTQIKQAIESHKPYEHLLLIEGASSMGQVVQAASKLARQGDIVLLSPACKSFDMFKSYKERGDKFKEEVEKL